MTSGSLISRLNLFIIVIVSGGKTFAQNPALKNSEEDYTWWYITLLGLAAALTVTIVLWMKKKKAAQEVNAKEAQRIKDSFDDGDSISFDADEEFEWMRKNKQAANKNRKKTANQVGVSKNSRTFGEKEASASEIPTPLSIELLNETPLPVFDLERLEPSAKVEPLPLSNDESLLNAIEQSQDEYEEDEEVRDLAVRVLAAFRTRSSVEALSQVAIYDLASALRSKAVSVLSEFDHESCFEGILLACADPTREVRAAAARAFSRLTFDRADAWMRIIETKEQGRMIHASRAALEGGFVERSFDRLTHRDKKLAYEAAVLVALLVKAGEVQQIAETLESHRDMQVRRAIIHVLSVVNGENANALLQDVVENKGTSEEVRKEAEKALAQGALAVA